MTSGPQKVVILNMMKKIRIGGGAGFAGDRVDPAISVGHGGGHAGLGEYAHQHTGAVQGADHKHRIGTVEAHDLLLILPITPLTPATLLMTGMCDLDLGEHQRYTIKFVWPLSIVLLILLTVFGLIL